MNSATSTTAMTLKLPKPNSTAAYQAKEDKDLGWPLCKTICDHGSEHCKSCPHLALGKSPLNLGLQQANAPATTIRIVKGEIARMVDEAEAALLAVADAAPIMVRAGMLVQPIVDLLPASHGRKTEVVLLRTTDRSQPRSTCSTSTPPPSMQYDGRSKKWLAVDPPPAIATQLLEKGRWQFPKVAGVITAPTLRPDGTILDRSRLRPGDATLVSRPTANWCCRSSALTRHASRPSRR